jgi:hypothetical protein
MRASLLEGVAHHAIFRSGHVWHAPTAAILPPRELFSGFPFALEHFAREGLLARGGGSSLQSQYAAHPSWTAQLHRDNLEAAAKQEPNLRPVPSYSTIRLRCHDAIFHFPQSRIRICN